MIDSDMWNHVDALFAAAEGLPIGEKKRRAAQGVPIGRFGTPDEVAETAVFVVSNAASYFTAQTFGVDGANWMA